MAPVLSLDSDLVFIGTQETISGIGVWEYGEDSNMFNMIRASCPRWKYMGRVSAVPYKKPEWSVLKVFGVEFNTITVFSTLAKDLNFPGLGDRKMSIKVNRQGACYVNYAGEREPFMWMRMNGSFCWAKYGVVNPGHQASHGTKNDVVLSRPLAIMAADQRYTVEEVNPTATEEEEENAKLRKLLEEKNKEVASLKAALKILCDN